MKYIVNVRGTLKGTRQQAQKVHDEIIAKMEGLTKSMGGTSHMTFLSVQNEKEFFSIDGWDNLESIQKLYNDPALGAEFARLFEGQPTITVWAESGFAGY